MAPAHPLFISDLKCVDHKCQSRIKSDSQLIQHTNRCNKFNHYQYPAWVHEGSRCQKKYYIDCKDVYSKLNLSVDWFRIQIAAIDSWTCCVCQPNRHECMYVDFMMEISWWWCMLISWWWFHDDDAGWWFHDGDFTMVWSSESNVILTVIAGIKLKVSDDWNSTQ